MNLKIIILFPLISASAILCILADSPSTQETSINQEDVNKQLIKLNEKLDLLNEKVQKLEKSTESNEIYAEENKMKTLQKMKAIERCSFRCAESKSLDVCSTNPCLNGGKCQTTPSGDYECTQCPYLTTGKYCQDLNCGKAERCFQLNGIAYFVFEKRLIWKEADQLCVDKGMQLALLKDKNITDHVTRTLSAKYEREVHACFWFGLRNNGDGRKWRWTDGSSFGGYTGVEEPYTPFKIYYDLKRCALMFFYNGDLVWSPHPCTYLNDPYQHYPLCQMNISHAD